ncbi:hypothetical protein LCGC14_0995260 [marine sediment metagenome]|uniref:Uncharacterized protein n=1 Tax=marine sediment metagenome TaxID=412755 RepID=A0A0F9RAX9_9ZZZZ
MLTITTESGAVYYIEGSNVRGGSLEIQKGTLISGEPFIGQIMLIETPERHHLNPHFSTAGVQTTPIVEIEETLDNEEIL